MPKSALFIILFCVFYSGAFTQDSAWVRLRPSYNEVGRLHRFFFGENYRAEWSDSTYLPIIDPAQVEGGLKPIRLGGGHQTVSLRLADASGREWVLRHVEKDASILLPPAIRQTFAKDLIDDAMSAQHPFSPPVVAELARAAGVPQATPRVGIIKSSPLLGEYNKLFANKVCLLEEREPFGNSENSLRLFADLDKDNDNNVDAKAFVRARLLDLLIADWDRHPDQWRWVDMKKGKEKLYVGIPRDRDQAFYVNEGVFPKLASRPWFVPLLQGFSGKIKHPRFSLKESSFLHSRPAMHMPLEEWMSITREFTAAITDSVLENALQKLPPAAYARRHRQMLELLKERRNNLPAAMESYYRFVNRVADIQLSDKHEFVRFSTAGSDSLSLQVYKKSKAGGLQPLFQANYSPAVTKEIRLYTGAGNDSLVFDAATSPIKLRVIGGGGEKTYHVQSAQRKIRVYENTSNHHIAGDHSKLRVRRSDDSLHTAYMPTNRYHLLKPLVAAGFNRDDGLLVGLGMQYTHQGFRKTPYASLNRIILYHSFATSAFRLKYAGEWIRVLPNADIVAVADIFAPQNTQNFFGRGNESVFNKTGDHITFYRTRFNLYHLFAGLRWTGKKGWAFSAGPSLQHYRFDSSDNKGRILRYPSLINSYDSNSVGEPKTHLGLMMNTGIMKKNDRIMPTKGFHVNIKTVAYAGLNDASKSFAQIVPEFSMYLPISSKRNIVLAERVGGGVSIGSPAFYQSLFTGGHENLLGYRQYRFAGDHLLYNNLELRLKIANFTGYIIPGEFGMIAFYDVGRVWAENETSSTWHQGKGGGLYFAPAKLVVLSVVAGHSTEGWYPYVTLGFRY